MKRFLSSIILFAAAAFALAGQPNASSKIVKLQFGTAPVAVN